MFMQSSPRPARREPRKLSFLRVFLGTGCVLAAILVFTWWFVHRYEWAGPWVANTLRSVIGTDRVAQLEETVYGVEDRWNQVWRKSEKPRAYWEVPPVASTVSGILPPRAAGAAPSGSASAAAPRLSFHPPDVGPMHKSWSAPGDGAWVPMADARHPTEEPRLWKTLLHPDAGRSWAELFVVAVDLRQVRLQAMPGYQEPKSLAPEGAEKMKERTPARPALVPAADQEQLLAAFNGGFMAEHGYYGMRVAGVTLVEARKNACTIAAYPGERIRIRSYAELEATRGEQLWFRQTPACMAESGKLHPGLADPHARTWGATLDGETVIRRSAIGLDDTGNVLYVGISNSTTAKVMAQGMLHAGAVHVAQLDVNWSYPKLLTYQPATPGGELVGVPAMPGFEFDPADYVRKRAMRDFFYLTRKVDGSTSGGTAAPISTVLPVLLPAGSSAPAAAPSAAAAAAASAVAAPAAAGAAAPASSAAPVPADRGGEPPRTGRRKRRVRSKDE